MPNQIANPFAAPLGLLKQIGEQANVTIQSFGTSMSQAASSGLDMLMGAAPPLPGVPGNTAARLAGPPQLPSLQQLLPANLAQALTQIEQVAIPAGLPRLSQMMGARPPTPTPPAPTPTPPAPTARRRVAERRGI